MAKGQINELGIGIGIEPELSKSGAYRKDLQTETQKAIADALKESTKILEAKSVDVLRHKLEGLTEKVKTLAVESPDKAWRAQEQRLKIQQQLAREIDKENGIGIGNGVGSVKSKISQVSKFSKSFGRISVYRLIRTALKEIADAFKESFSTISRLSTEFNNSMSSITSSIEVVKATLGVGLYQILIVTEPILKGVALTVATIGNSLSLVTAQIRGQNTYLKANLDYWKDYQDTLNGALLSFDTFTTLSDDSKFGIIIESNVADESENLTAIWATVAAFVALAVNNASPLSGILSKVVSKSSTLSKLFGTSSNSAENLTLSLDNATNSTTSLKDKLSGVASAISGAYLTVTGIIKLSEWDNLSGWQKFLGILQTISGVAAVVAGLLAFSSNPSVVGVAKAVAGIATIVGTGSAVISAVSAFADGGIMESAGTMYAVAGEAGPEIVAQGSRGTGVATVEQFSEAMYSALVRYGAATGEDVRADNNYGSNSETIDFGKYIARSPSFINEINRKNPKLKLK